MKTGEVNFNQGDTIMQITPLSFVRSARYGYSSGSNNGRTSRGYYWSGCYHSIDNSRSVGFYSTYLNPQYGDPRGYGHTLRCLARQIPYKKNRPTNVERLDIIEGKPYP